MIDGVNFQVRVKFAAVVIVNFIPKPRARSATAANSSHTVNAKVLSFYVGAEEFCRGPTAPFTIAKFSTLFEHGVLPPT